MVQRLGVLLVVLSVASFAMPSLHAQGVEELGSRDGNNSIYFRWNNTDKRVTGAESGRTIFAGARVEILTALRDRTGKIFMRAVIRNTSDYSVFHVDGRLVHNVWDESGALFREVKSRAIDAVLTPGDEVKVRFAYVLPSGRYRARTDFEAR